MHFLIDSLSRYCLAKEIISPTDVTWFKYGIEKRLSTLIVAIPFFIFAVILSNIYTAISFYFSFYFLRSRTNGFHSKSAFLCFVLSLLLEALFLGILGPLVSPLGGVVLAAASGAIIFVFAPYNHPNMHLSSDEIVACRTSSRIRSIVILVCTLLSFLTKLPVLVNGFSLGIAMAACLLCLAYILNGGKINENNSKLH